MESETETTFRSLSLPGRGYEFFEEMKKNKEFFDVTFRVGDQSISAHRIIVAAAIPYFHDALSNKASHGGEEIEFFLRDVDFSALECLIGFAYTCEVVITMENVKDLLRAAYHLGVEEVSDACCDFLIEHVEPENALKIREFGSDINCTELLEYIDSHVRENFDAVTESEEFLNVPFPYLKELLLSDYLCVVSEERAFEAAMKWIKKCPEEREANLPELLRAVRMPLLSQLYLKNHVATEDLIRNSIPCRNLLDEARDFHSFPEERSDLCSFSIEPRYSTESSSECDPINEYLYVLYDTYELSAKYLHNLEDGWITEKKYPYFSNTYTSAELNNEIYVFSGHVAKKYDPLNSEFEFLANMPSDRVYAGAGTLDNEIYVCGGLLETTNFSDAVDCYDPETNKWREINAMPACRRSPGVATLGKSLYVLGGQDRSGVHASVDKYDSSTKRWSPAPPMLTERYSFACTTFDGRIYVCGGKTSNYCCTASAEVFDPVEQKWEHLSPMNTAKRYLKLLPYRGKLYALGGEDDNGSSTNTVEIYDPETDLWTFGTALERESFVMAGAVVLLPEK